MRIVPLGIAAAATLGAAALIAPASALSLPGANAPIVSEAGLQPVTFGWRRGWRHHGWDDYDYGYRPYYGWRGGYYDDGPYYGYRSYGWHRPYFGFRRGWRRGWRHW